LPAIAREALERALRAAVTPAETSGAEEKGEKEMGEKEMGEAGEEKAEKAESEDVEGEKAEGEKAEGETAEGEKAEGLDSEAELSSSLVQPLADPSPEESSESGSSEDDAHLAEASSEYFTMARVSSLAKEYLAVRELVRKRERSVQSVVEQVETRKHEHYARLLKLPRLIDETLSTWIDPAEDLLDKQVFQELLRLMGLPETVEPRLMRAMVEAVKQAPTTPRARGDQQRRLGRPGA